MADAVDLTEPLDPEEPLDLLLGRVISAVAGFRAALDRDRRLKRALLLLGAVAIAGLIIQGITIKRQNDVIDRLNGTVAQNSQIIGRLDKTNADLAAERDARASSVCKGAEGLLNTITDLQPPPISVEQQWLLQARLNHIEQVMEANYASFGCDFHPTPIPDPPAPPPLPAG